MALSAGDGVEGMKGGIITITVVTTCSMRGCVGSRVMGAAYWVLPPAPIPLNLQWKWGQRKPQ